MRTAFSFLSLALLLTAFASMAAEMTDIDGLRFFDPLAGFSLFCAAQVALLTLSDYTRAGRVTRGPRPVREPRHRSGPTLEASHPLAA